ncbi:hypothetical protein [Motiliproteus sediminis]|uniref:hypothetical protein n=1 Tax=Motiliproteus sediminis TaxID=1468178 RepID=UPI001AF013A2|nr:hypothetical protein [Motiliproteus sediminis]
MPLFDHPSAIHQLSNQELLQQFEQELLTIQPHSSLYTMMSTLRELATRFYEEGQLEACRFVEMMERAVDSARQDRRHLNAEFVQTLMNCQYFLLGKLEQGDSLRFNTGDVEYRGVKIGASLLQLASRASTNATYFVTAPTKGNNHDH